VLPGQIKLRFKCGAGGGSRGGAQSGGNEEAKGRISLILDGRVATIIIHNCGLS